MQDAELLQAYAPGDAADAIGALASVKDGQPKPAHDTLAELICAVKPRAWRAALSAKRW